MSTLSLEEARTLLSGKILNRDICDLSLEEQIESYNLLTFIEGLIKKRKEVLKDNFDVVIESTGESDEDRRVLEVGDRQIYKDRRVAKVPDPEGLKELILATNQGRNAKKKLQLTDAFDEIPQYEINPSKLQKLIDLGKLDEDAVVALYKETFTIRVSATPEDKRRFAALRGSSGGSEEISEDLD